MKKIVLAFLLALALAAPVFADEQTQTPPEWEEIVQSAPMTAEEFRLSGLEDWIERGAEIVREAVGAPIRLLAAVSASLILAALVRGIVPTEAPSGAAALDTAAAVGIFVLCAGVLTGVTEYAQQAFTSASQYLASFVPVFAGVVAACGQTGSAAVYSGLFFTASMIVSQLFSTVGIPFLHMHICLCAVSCVDSGVDTGALAGQLARWVKWCLAAAATAFTALLGMQSILAHSADSFALKTGKLVVSSSIPVVGKAMSDALGTVLAGLHLMKATVGFAVIAVTAAAFVPVLTQCAVYQASFAAARAVAAALGVRRAERLLDGFSKCMGLCMAMCGLFGFMVLTATILMVVLGGG